MKKIIATICSIAIIMTLCVPNIMAEETENLTWDLDSSTDVLTISGSDEATDNESVVNVLINNRFETYENCNTVENGKEYTIMPALANGDYNEYSWEGRTYDMEGMTLSTCSRQQGDESSYFKIETEPKESVTNNYLTTSICRFANSNRGSKIDFNEAQAWTVAEDEYLVLAFNVKMQDGLDTEDTAFQIGNVSLSRSELGVENDEWAQVMAVYDTETGVKLYKCDNSSIGEMIKSGEDITFSTISFNYEDERKSENHPYGYPLVSLDNVYVYTVAEEDFGFHNLNEFTGFEGKLNSPGNVCWDGSVAKWDGVEHAKSYIVELLRNGEVVKTINNITETSYDLSEDIKDGRAYRFSVVAVSDEDIYCNSSKVLSGIYSLNTIKVGEYLQMGTYCGQSILWRCIDIDENGPRFVADKMLCVKVYDAPATVLSGSHTSIGSLSLNWYDSNLRCWLNSNAPAGEVVWECGNPPDSTALKDTSYDAYDDEAGFMSTFSLSEQCTLKKISNNISVDKVSLLKESDIEVFKCNLDILGPKYGIGYLTEDMIENSEYLKNLYVFDTITHTEKLVASGDAFQEFVLSNEYGGVFTMDKTGMMISGYDCAGVRPVIYIQNGFELSGDGTQDTPYTVVEGTVAKLSVQKKTISPQVYDIINIPVSISENEGFASAAVSVNYDKNKFTLLTVTPSLSLLGTTFNYSQTDDGVNVLAVNPENITGNLELFTVSLLVDINALNTESIVSIEPTEFFNEDKKPIMITTDNKETNIVLNVSGDVDNNSKVDSADAIMLSQYLAKYKNTSLTDNQKNNADVYTDEKINIKDMYVLSQYIVNNLSQLSSSVSLLSSETPKISASAKYVENDNSMIDVTLSIENNTGFTGFLFNMGFDNTKFTPVSINVADVLKSESITSNVNESGIDLSTLSEVTALLNTANDISADGKLYTVRFKINGELTDDDSISFTNSGFTSKVEDITIDTPETINLKEALNSSEDEESDNEVKNLKATASDGQIVLSWDKNDNAMAYVIYKNDEQIQTIFETSYTVTGLENGIQYTFTVKTLGNSGMSEGVSVKATPSANSEEQPKVHMTYSNGTATISSDNRIENAVVIFAEYDNSGAIVSIEMETVTIETDSSTEVAKTQSIADGNTLKVMLWNNLKEMKPLHDVVED